MSDTTADEKVFYRIRAHRVRRHGRHPPSCLDAVRGCRLSRPLDRDQGESHVKQVEHRHGHWLMVMIPPVIQLVDAKEAGYLSTNNPPQGEIYLRGPSVTGGYFKRPDLNKEVSGIRLCKLECRKAEAKSGDDSPLPKTAGSRRAISGSGTRTERCQLSSESRTSVAVTSRHPLTIRATR